MKALIYNLYDGFAGLKTAFCRLIFSAYILLTIYGGGSLPEMIFFACILFLYVFLPGKCLDYILKFSDDFTNIKGFVELLLGTGFFCATYCVSMRLHMKILLIILPLILSIIYILILLKNKVKIVKVKITSRQQLLILLLFSLIFLYTCACVIKNALPIYVRENSTLLNADILWNIGNANSFALRFIPEDIRYSGVQLHYHYLTEMFAGAISWMSGISAYNIIGFYMQPWVLLCVIYCLYNFAMVYFADENKSTLFTFSMFLFGCGSMWKSFLNGRSAYFNDNAYHIITNVNSQATAVIFLCIFSSMFIQMLNNDFKVNIRQITIWFAAFFMLCFAKGPVAAIVAIGGVITLIWLFMQKKVSWKGPVAGVVLGALFFVIYSLFFASGANTSMAFNIWGTLDRTIFAEWLGSLYYMNGTVLWYAAHVLCMIVMVLLFTPLQGFLYYVGLVKDIKNLFKLNGVRLWINSVVVGGFMAFFLFSHYALSQVYFAFVALFYMHILAIDALYLLKHNLLKYITAVLAVICITTSGFIYVNTVGSGARFLARNVGIIEKYRYNVMVNSDDYNAMEYFRENSSEKSLFATNRIHSNTLGEDGISNVYSAFSGRQSYMEGYAYALTNMGVPYYVVSQRKEINQLLFSAGTSVEELKFLCQTTGITHLIYSSQIQGTDSVIATVYPKVYDSETVRIYETGVEPMENHPLYQEELARYGEGIKEE